MFSPFKGAYVYSHITEKGLAPQSIRESTTIIRNSTCFIFYG